MSFDINFRNDALKFCLFTNFRLELDLKTKTTPSCNVFFLLVALLLFRTLHMNGTVSVFIFGWCITFPLTVCLESLNGSFERFFQSLFARFPTVVLLSSKSTATESEEELHWRPINTNRLCYCCVRVCVCVTAVTWTAHCGKQKLLFGSFTLTCGVSDLQDSFSPHPNTQVLFRPGEDLLTVPSSSSSSSPAVDF